MLTDEDIIKIKKLKDYHSVYKPWTDAYLFRKIIDSLTEPFYSTKVDKVVGIEGKGFILGAPVAYNLNAGFVVIRKKGRMYRKGYSQSKVFSINAIDYTGFKKTLELEKHIKSIESGDNILLVDDWFQKGGQGQAAISLIEKAGGKIIGVSILFDEMEEETRNKFRLYNLHSLITLK
jgi:adenine phosphoribosyltransferase